MRAGNIDMGSLRNIVCFCILIVLSVRFAMSWRENAATAALENRTGTVAVLFSATVHASDSTILGTLDIPTGLRN